MKLCNWSERTEGDKAKILSVVCAFLVGIICGFLFSPIKKGIYCGNNNGNGYIEGCDTVKRSREE